jgi:hypothetical protein
MIWIGIGPMNFMKVSEKSMNALSNSLLGVKPENTSEYKVLNPSLKIK